MKVKVLDFIISGQNKSEVKSSDVIEAEVNKALSGLDVADVKVSTYETVVDDRSHYQKTAHKQYDIFYK